MKPIIKVENLSKQYKIGEARQPYSTLRESLVESIKSPFKKFQKVNEENTFWALNDVSFEVMPGEVVGIIGRNGAGKSTLLKVLSRITEPTKGKVELYGRVASLLEVGTGFHPELTGRENIYLNGTVLGMKHEEISKKFDEIVDFSGVEKFIDTPVKHYSSGMSVRLAFAVAAHLEPEILVIDEVLAVGDIEFQKKCLGKMDEVSKSGRTILFVSHNMGAVTSLCSQAVLLHKGELLNFGETTKMISQYFNEGQASFCFENDRVAPDDSHANLLCAYVCDTNFEKKGRFYINEEFRICVEYEILKDVNAPIVISLRFNNENGESVFLCMAQDVKPQNKGKYIAICKIPKDFLNNGLFSVSIGSATYFTSDYTKNYFYNDILMIDMVENLHDNPMRYGYGGSIPGFVRPLLDFKVTPKE